MSTESELYRQQMLAQAERIITGPKPLDVRDAEKVVEAFQANQAGARARFERLRRPLPAANLCPRCWFQEGHSNPLHAVPHPDPDHYDRLRCAICNFDEDRKTRS